MTIHIGLVGLGFMGKTHLDAYQYIENCKVKTICKRQIDSEDENLAKQYNVHLTKEYDDLLRDKEIEVIDICLPTYLHEQYILQAARAGKHIICEKPLTLTVASAKRIKEAVQKNGVQLFVGHVLRFWPEYKLFKSYSETEKLAHIEIVHAKRLSQKPTWSEWFQHPEKSGGALFDLHIHDIDFATYLLGEVASVYAVGKQNKQGAWDHIMTTLYFKNKSKAFIEASHRMPMLFPFTMALRVQGKNSILDFRVEAGKNIENRQESNTYMTYYNNEEMKTVDVEKTDAFQNELAYFINCIEQDRENNIIPFDDVLYTLKVLQAIERSLETEQIISM